VRRKKVAPRAYETARNRYCGVKTRSWVSVKVNNTLIMSLYQDILASFKKWAGKQVDFDWQYANQCVDWVKQYAVDIGYPITTKGNAKDYVKGLWKNWIKVPEWQVGDIVVFPNGTYGHIAVVVDIVWSVICVNEQNRDWKAFSNNNSKNKGTPVRYWNYAIKWNEVFFRPMK